MGRLLRGTGGQSLVEFAIAAMLFMLMLFGIMDFGIGIYRYNMIANLAQEGARWASVHGSQCLTPCVAASTGDVQTFVRSRAPNVPVDVTTTPGNPSGLLPGAIVTVVAQTTYAPLTGAIPQFTMTFQSTASMTMSR